MKYENYAIYIVVFFLVCVPPHFLLPTRPFCTFIPNDEVFVLPVLRLSVYSGDESALLRIYLANL